MPLNNSFFLFYKNNILEKKIKCNKINNVVRKKEDFINVKYFYSVFCVKNSIDISCIENNEHSYRININVSCDSDEQSLEESLLEIDKIFEGRNSGPYSDLNLYYNVSILKKLFSQTKDGYKIFFTNSGSCKFLKSFIYSSIFIYKKSLIIYPLTLDSINFNMYISSIYYYIFSRSSNLYVSSFIALFYYFNGLLVSLLSIYGDNTIDILYSNIILIVTRLSLFIMVLRSIDNFVKVGSIMSFKIINIINNILNLFNLNYYIYKPCLIGVTNYTLHDTGILAKLSFQNILKTIKGLILEDKIDWKIDSKSNIILSDFVPVNSGWYRYFINF